MNVTHKNDIPTEGWQCSGDLKPVLGFCPALWNGFGSQGQSYVEKEHTQLLNMDATLENESLTQGFQCPGEDKSEWNFGPDEWSGSGSSFLQTPPKDSENLNFVEDALLKTLEEQMQLLNMDMTHEDESLTQGLQCLGEDDPESNFGRAEMNGLVSSLSQTPPNASQNFKFVEDALLNILILRKIFTFLKDRDLESCCYVSQYWRTVADPLVVPHYDIKLAVFLSAWARRRYASHNHTSWDEHVIMVRERARYNRKIFTQRTDIAGVTQILEIILTQKVSISLRLSNYVNFNSKKIMDFFSKIGSLVLSLDVRQMGKLPMNVVDFCKLLLQKFPNLQKLNVCSFEPRSPNDSIEVEPFNTDLPQNQHKKLRKIRFGNGSIRQSCVETILKIAPNVEKIENFPPQLVNTIVAAKKGPALKSLYNFPYSSDEFRQNGETMESAYKKLAQLQPKLTSLEIHSDGFASRNTFELVKPFFLSILQSSHESLKSLFISSLKSDEVLHFPILKGLKELRFLFPYREFPFPPEVPVTKIFPKVTKITSYSDWDESEIWRHLRKNTISPWGTQINHLKVLGLPVHSIPLLQRFFPSTQQLRMCIPVKDISKSLLQLSLHWPQLKSLTISFDIDPESCCMMRGKPFRLDHGITGLPEKIIDQLENPSRKKNFTQEEIQGFKDQSIICKFKELKEFKLYLTEQRYIPGRENYTHLQLTPVANEFGFQLLPELRVTVGVGNRWMFDKEMKRDLELLALCNNIEIVDDNPYAFDKW